MGTCDVLVTLRITALLGAALIDFAVFAYASFDQLNVIFNIATIVVAIAVAFPIIRSRRKDVTIRELSQSVDSKDTLLESLRDDIEGLKIRAKRSEDECHEVKLRAEHWEARYTEQARYTAEGALQTIGERLAAMEAVLGNAFSAHGELVMKNAELLTTLIEQMKQQAKDGKK